MPKDDSSSSSSSSSSAITLPDVPKIEIQLSNDKIESLTMLRSSLPQRGSLLEYFLSLIADINPLAFLAVMKHSTTLHPFYDASKVFSLMKGSCKPSILKPSSIIVMTKACEVVSALYKTHVTKPIPTHRDIPPHDYSFDIFVDPNMVSGPTFVTTSSYHPLYACKPPYLMSILKNSMGLHHQLSLGRNSNSPRALLDMYDFTKQSTNGLEKSDLAIISNNSKARFIGTILYSLLMFRKMAVEEDKDITDVIGAEELYQATFTSYYGIIPNLSGNFLFYMYEDTSFINNYFVDPDNDLDPIEFSNPTSSPKDAIDKCHTRLITLPWEMIQRRVKIATDMGDVFANIYTQIAALNTNVAMNEESIKQLFDSQHGLLSTQQVSDEEDQDLSPAKRSLYYRQTMEAHMIAFVAYSLRHAIAKAGNDQGKYDFPVQWLLVFAQCNATLKWKDVKLDIRSGRFSKLVNNSRSTEMFRLYYISMIETSVVLCMLLMNELFYKDAGGIYVNLNATSQDILNRVLASILSLPMLDGKMSPIHSYEIASAPNSVDNCILYLTHLCESLMKQDTGMELLNRVIPIWSHLPDGFLQGQHYSCDRYGLEQSMGLDASSNCDSNQGLTDGHANVGYAEDLIMKHCITHTTALPTPYCSFIFITTLVETLTRDTTVTHSTSLTGLQREKVESHLSTLDKVPRKCLRDDDDISGLKPLSTEPYADLIKQLPAMLLKTIVDLFKPGRSRINIGILTKKQRILTTFRHLCDVYGLEIMNELPILRYHDGSVEDANFVKEYYKTMDEEGGVERGQQDDYYGVKTLEEDKKWRQLALPECWDVLRGFISIIILINHDYNKRYNNDSGRGGTYTRLGRFKRAIQSMINEMTTLKVTLIHASNNNEGTWNLFKTAIRMNMDLKTNNYHTHRGKFDDAYFHLNEQVRQLLLLLVNEDLDQAFTLKCIQLRESTHIYHSLYDCIMPASTSQQKKNDIYGTASIYEFCVYYPEALQIPVFRSGIEFKIGLEVDNERLSGKLQSNTHNMRSILTDHLLKQYKLIVPNKLYPSIVKSDGIKSGGRFNSFNTMNLLAISRILHQDSCTSNDIWRDPKNVRMIMRVAAITMDPLLIVKVMRFMKRLIISKNAPANAVPEDYRDQKNIIINGVSSFHYDSTEDEDDIILHPIRYEYSSDSSYDGTGWHPGSKLPEINENRETWLNFHEDYNGLVGFPLASMRFLFTQDVNLAHADLRMNSYDSYLSRPHMARSSSIFDYWSNLRDTSNTYLLDADAMQLDDNEYQALWEYFNGFYLDVEKNLRVLVENSTKDTTSSISHRHTPNLGMKSTSATATFKALMICSALGLHELMSTIMNINTCYTPEIGDWALLIDCYDSFGAVMIGPWREKNPSISSSPKGAAGEHMNSKQLTDKTNVAKVKTLNLHLLYLDKDFRMKAPALHVAMPYLSKLYKVEPLITSSHRHYQELSTSDSSILFTQIPSIVFARKLLSLTFNGWSLPLITHDLGLAPDVVREAAIVKSKYQHTGTAFEKKQLPHAQYIENLNLSASLYEFMFYQTASEDMQESYVYLYEQNYNKWEVTMNKWIDAYFYLGPVVQTPLISTPSTWNDKTIAKRPYLRFLHALKDMTLTKIKNDEMKELYLPFDKTRNVYSFDRGTFVSTAMFLSIIIKYYPKQYLIEQLNNIDIGADIRSDNIFKCNSSSRCKIGLNDLALVLKEELPTKHCTGYRETIISWLAYRLLKCNSIEVDEEEKLELRELWTVTRPLVIMNKKRSKQGNPHVRHHIGLVDSMEYPLDLDFAIAVLDLATNASVETYKIARDLSSQSFPQGYLFPSVHSGMAKLEMIVTSCSTMENLLSIQMSNGQFTSMIDLLYPSRFALPKTRAFYGTIDTKNTNKSTLLKYSDSVKAALHSKRDINAIGIIINHLRHSSECLLEPVIYPEGCLGEPCKPVITRDKIFSYHKHLPIVTYKNIHNETIHVDQLLHMNRRLAVSPAFLIRPLEYQKGEIVTLDIVIREGLMKRCRQGGSTLVTQMNLLGHLIVCYARLYDDVKIANEVGFDETYCFDLRSKVNEFRCCLLELSNNSVILQSFLDLCEKFTIDNILKLKQHFIAIEIDNCSQVDWSLWNSHEELVCCLILTLKSPMDALDVYSTLHKISSDTRFTEPAEDINGDTTTPAPPPPPTTTTKGKSKGRGKAAPPATSSNAFKLNEEDMFRCLRFPSFNKVLRLASLFTRTDSLIGVCATMIGRVLLADENQCCISGTYLHKVPGGKVDGVEIHELHDYHTPVVTRILTYLEVEKMNYEKYTRGTGMLYEIEKMILDAIQIIPGKYLWDNISKSVVPLNTDLTTTKLSLVTRLTELHNMRKNTFPTELDDTSGVIRPFADLATTACTNMLTISSPSHFILKVLHITRLDPERWYNNANNDYRTNDHNKMIPTLLDFENILHTVNVMQFYSEPNADALTSAWKTFVGYLDVDMPRCPHLFRRNKAYCGHFNWEKNLSIDFEFPPFYLNPNDKTLIPTMTTYIGGLQNIARQMFVRKALMSLHEYLHTAATWAEGPKTDIANTTRRYNYGYGKTNILLTGKLTPNKVLAILMMAYGTSGDPFWMDTMDKTRESNATGADYNLFWLKVDKNSQVNKDISDIPVHQDDQIVITQSGYGYIQAISNLLCAIGLEYGQLPSCPTVHNPTLFYCINKCRYIQNSVKYLNGLSTIGLVQDCCKYDETYRSQCHALKHTACRGMPIRKNSDAADVKILLLQYEMLPLLQIVKLPYLAYNFLNSDGNMYGLLDKQWLNDLQPHKVMINLYDHVNTLPTAKDIWREHMCGVLKYCKSQTAMTKKRRDTVTGYIRFMQVFLCKHQGQRSRLDVEILLDWCKVMKEKKPFIKELRYLSNLPVNTLTRENLN